MGNLLLSLNLLLAQTEQEKKLTMLYVGLFVFVMLLLVLDGRSTENWMSNKTLKWIAILFFFIAAIALIVLYFVL